MTDLDHDFLDSISGGVLPTCMFDPDFVCIGDTGPFWGGRMTDLDHAECDHLIGGALTTLDDWFIPLGCGLPGVSCL